jgi:hypothetical protein
MKGNERLGIIVLAIWLILTGLLESPQLNFANSEIILQLLALVAGVTLLAGVLRLANVIRPGRSIGFALLGLWLILTALLPMLNLVLPFENVVWAALAVIAGVLLLLS